MEGSPPRVGKAPPATIGHNSEVMTVEEKVANLYHSKKDRIFVRGFQGEYNVKKELDRLRSAPRVLKAKEIGFVDGPQAYSRHYVEPKDGVTQTFHMHLEEYAPGGYSQKHGHVNEAAFYILDGEGYEIHDGVRYDWKAGDVAIVHNNCVHQHFNASKERPARCLVITEDTAESTGFEVREEEVDFNHPEGGY